MSVNHLQRQLRRFATDALGVGVGVNHNVNEASQGPRQQALTPAVISRSPIAALDQRLAHVDHPGMGLEGGVGFGVDAGDGSDQSDATAVGREPTEVGREPRAASQHGAPASAATTAVTIQRKANSSAATSVGPATPAARGSATPGIHGATAATRGATPTDSAPVGPASPRPALDRPAALAPERREPMDPGPLFELPRFEPSSNTDASAGLMPAEPRRGSTPAPGQPTITLDATPRRQTLALSTVVADARPAPWSVPSPSVVPRPPRSPSPALPGAPVRPRPRVDAPAAPLELRPSSPAAQPLRVVVEIEPRATAAAPFVPERAAAASPRPQPQSTTAARRPAAASSRAPTPAPSPASAPRPGRLTIDSVSQIGPLDRHFPNRRRMRLRYR